MALLQFITGAVAAGLFVLTLLVHVAAARLAQTRPELLQGVGIDRIDWWFGFYRGIWRLAFSPAANELTKNDRLVLRMFWLFFVLFLPAGIALHLSGR